MNEPRSTYRGPKVDNPYKVVSQPIRPRRDDSICNWLYRQRDNYPDGSEKWNALNDLILDYCRRSDLGQRIKTDGR